MKQSHAHSFVYYLGLLLCYNSRLNTDNKDHVILKAKNINYLALYGRVKYGGLFGVQNHWKFFTESLNPLENGILQCMIYHRLSLAQSYI